MSDEMRRARKAPCTHYYLSAKSTRCQGCGAWRERRGKELVQGCDKLLVTPSGYATDPKVQIKFYESNGFSIVAHEGTSALMQRTPTALERAER